MSFSELSILMVILLARSSTALRRVRLRHIHDGLVNRSFDIFVIFWSPREKATEPVDKLYRTVSAAACCHGTGPSCPIPIARFPFH